MILIDIAGDIFIAGSCLVPPALDPPLTLAGGVLWVWGGIVNGDPFTAGLGSLMIVLAVRGWWRRRRKRAPRAYGAKSLALVAGLVRRAREAARPRPVLRPAPGGARG